MVPSSELITLHQQLLAEPTAAAFGPSRTEPPAPSLQSGARTALAIASSPLIGRADAVEAVEALVRRDDVRLISLLGPGGVGKTRLALAVAERAAGQLCWVELAGLSDAADVPEALIRGLGAERLVNESAEDALVRFLGPKRCCSSSTTWSTFWPPHRCSAGLSRGRRG